MRKGLSSEKPGWTPTILHKLPLKELTSIHVMVQRIHVPNNSSGTRELNRNIDDPAFISKSIHRKKGYNNTIWKNIFDRDDVHVNPEEDCSMSDTCRRRSRSRNRCSARSNSEVGASRRDDREHIGTASDADSNSSRSDSKPTMENGGNRRTMSSSDDCRRRNSKWISKERYDKPRYSASRSRSPIDRRLSSRERMRSRSPFGDRSTRPMDRRSRLPPPHYDSADGDEMGPYRFGYFESMLPDVYPAYFPYPYVHSSDPGFRNSNYKAPSV